ncbi:MAG: hypothetical protein LBG84_05210 [Treponema sp.]|nr:hypothetical protein [Treponema sp.]
MSKYLAYSFLYDDAADLRCDFEILTDEISSLIGFLRSLLNDKDRAADGDLEKDLETMNGLMYHLNPSLRTRVMVTEEELDWLYRKAARLEDPVKEGFEKTGKLTFVVPQGCVQAACAHIIRSKCKAAVRMISRFKQQGNQVEDLLLDFVNLFSGYFFRLALWFNKVQGVGEVPYTSRVY